MAGFGPSALGSASFRADYGLKYAYLAGAMYKGIASARLVTALAKAGLMGFFGTGGLRLAEIEQAILAIRAALQSGEAFGMNLLASPETPDLEMRTVDLYLKHGVKFVEAAAFSQVSASVVRFRFTGAQRAADGSFHCVHRVLAKISRPEVAQSFMSPAPEALLSRLVDTGQLTQEEAQAGRCLPVAQEVCVEADSGGHTDQGVASVLLPAMLLLRDELMREHRYRQELRVGLAGGIGTPEAAAAAFILGADFILTGSVNQCTVEAAISDSAKQLLEDMGVQDTAYTVSGDMFEVGAKIQVLRKGLLFPARASKLHELYSRHDSIEQIDAKTIATIQDKYFRKSLDAVWEETRAYYQNAHPSVLKHAEGNPKRKMALLFKWYFVHTTRLAAAGSTEQRVDYQIHCGPALGAFNQWVKNTPLQHWQQRGVAQIAEQLMVGAAEVLQRRLTRLVSPA